MNIFATRSKAGAGEVADAVVDGKVFRPPGVPDAGYGVGGR